MKQTAVEWLISKLQLFNITKEEHYEILCQIELEAKEMFEQQIIDARVKKPLQSEWDEAEQYYNETFGKSTPWYDEDQTTERMNIIGQNGNDGEHY